MKRILARILCLCLCLAAAAACAEEGADQFLLKAWNHSGIDFTYLRFDLYAGDEYRGLVASCPDEGEDFYRMSWTPGNPEDPELLRIEISYGVSDLPPEDAILQIMRGEPAEEHPLGILELVPEPGKVYKLFIAGGEDAASVLFAGNGVQAASPADLPEPPGEGEADRVISGLTDFFAAWNRNSLDDLLDLCDPGWKDAQEEPKNRLFFLMGNRIPLSVEIRDVSGEDGDPARTVETVAVMDLNNGGDPVRFRYRIRMVLQEDGRWLADPAGLAESERLEDTGE